MNVIPQVVVVGRALKPTDLVVEAFQLVIHVNGQPAKAEIPNDIDGISSDVDDSDNISR